MFIFLKDYSLCKFVNRQSRYLGEKIFLALVGHIVEKRDFYFPFYLKIIRENGENNLCCMYDLVQIVS